MLLVEPLFLMKAGQLKYFIDINDNYIYNINDNYIYNIHAYENFDTGMHKTVICLILHSLKNKS